MQINKKINIFLVDDNIFNLELNLQFLKLVGYENISTFTDLKTCTTSLVANPQIIIIDKNLDQSLDFIHTVKSSNPDIYFIVLVDISQVKDGQKSIEFGAFDYIIKDEETVSKIKVVLNKIHAVIEILETNRITPKQKFFRLITFI
jgi:DNA-binding NtrC family response regulator